MGQFCSKLRSMHCWDCQPIPNTTKQNSQSTWQTIQYSECNAHTHTRARTHARTHTHGHLWLRFDLCTSPCDCPWGRYGNSIRIVYNEKSFLFHLHDRFHTHRSDIVPYLYHHTICRSHRNISQTIRDTSHTCHWLFARENTRDTSLAEPVFDPCGEHVFP